MKKMTFIKKAFMEPLYAMHYLLAIPKLAVQFIRLQHFIYPKLNGYKIETDSSLGILFRLTAMPDEPTVGEKYFQSPRKMSPLDKGYVMKALQKKLDKSQKVLRKCFEILLEQPITRAGVLAWVACTLLANWGRTRMRLQRQTCSNDGFLLNLGAVMMAVAHKLHLFRDPSIEKISPTFCFSPSRLDLKDETRISATDR